MPCYYPKHGYQAKFGWTADKKKSNGSPLTIPCGKCMGCRIARSQEWAIRFIHEAQLWPDNSFITLTYDQESLPDYGTLVPKHFQKFMKRLRKENTEKTIRFFHCGEYGDKDGRPHYHAVIFNHGFPDRYHWRTDEKGNKSYRSPELEKLWDLGNSEVTDLNFTTAGYVARYSLKKKHGEMAREKYTVLDPETGELLGLKKPEYATMSNRPGIGKKWYDRYKSDIFPCDYVVMNGREYPVPGYYWKLLGREDEKLKKKLGYDRILKARENAWNNTPERLKVRETVKKAQMDAYTSRKL